MTPLSATSTIIQVAGSSTAVAPPSHVTPVYAGCEISRNSLLRL